MKKTLVLLTYLLFFSACNSGNVVDQIEKSDNSQINSGQKTPSEVSNSNYDDTGEELNTIPETTDSHGTTEKPEKSTQTGNKNIDSVSIETAEVTINDVKMCADCRSESYDFACSKLYWKNKEVDFACGSPLSPYDILQDRYLVYRSGFLYFDSHFIDLLTGEVSTIDAFLYGFQDYGITPDQNYLYFCQNAGMLSGGLDVFKLSPEKSPERPEWKTDKSIPQGCYSCGKYDAQKKSYLCLDLQEDGLIAKNINLETGEWTAEKPEKEADISTIAVTPTKPGVKNIAPEKELQDRTLIEAYYHFLYGMPEGRGALLEAAYNMRDANDVSFEKFQEWYKNVGFAKIKDFHESGDSRYSFLVTLEEDGSEERQVSTYQVEMEVKNNKLFTRSSIKLK